MSVERASICSSEGTQRVGAGREAPSRWPSKDLEGGRCPELCGLPHRGRDQIGDPHQVIGGGDQVSGQARAVEAPVARAPEPTHRLHPTEDPQPKISCPPACAPAGSGRTEHGEWSVHRSRNLGSCGQRGASPRGHGSLARTPRCRSPYSLRTLLYESVPTFCDFDKRVQHKVGQNYIANFMRDFGHRIGVTMISGKIHKKGLSLLGPIMLTIALLGACGTPEAPPPETVEVDPTPIAVDDRKPWEIEWEELVAAAQVEGHLVVHSARPNSLRLDGPLAEFARRFNIKTIHSGYGARGQQDERVIAERNAGRYLTDVGDGNFRRLRAEAVDAGAPIIDQLFHPDIDLSNWMNQQYYWWDGIEDATLIFGVNARDHRIGYNTDFVKKEELQTLDDFLNPKFKGKIGIRRLPTEGGGANAPNVGLYKTPEGREFLKRFWLEMEPVVTVDPRLNVDLLARGVTHVLWGIAAPDNPEWADAIKLGLPIAMTTIAIDRPFSASSQSAINLFDRAPHPNAAKLWINWWLSKEGWEVRTANAIAIGWRDDTAPLYKGPRNPLLEPHEQVWDLYGDRQDALIVDDTDPAFQAYSDEANQYFLQFARQAGY